MGLPAIWVLAAVTIGGSLGGIGGMLLSVPTASALYILIREETAKRAKAKGLPPLPAEPAQAVPKQSIRKKPRKP